MKDFPLLPSEKITIPAAKKDSYSKKLKPGWTIYETVGTTCVNFDAISKVFFGDNQSYSFIFYDYEELE